MFLFLFLLYIFIISSLVQIAYSYFQRQQDKNDSDSYQTANISCLSIFMGSLSQSFVPLLLLSMRHNEPAVQYHIIHITPINHYRSLVAGEEGPRYRRMVELPVSEGATHRKGKRFKDSKEATGKPYKWNESDGKNTSLWSKSNFTDIASTIQEMTSMRSNAGDNKPYAVDIKTYIEKYHIKNMHIHEFTHQQLSDRIYDRLGIRIVLSSDLYYKLADFKPT